jgi:hypothetical protein
VNARLTQRERSVPSVGGQGDDGDDGRRKVLMPRGEVRREAVLKIRGTRNRLIKVLFRETGKQRVVKRSTLEKQMVKKQMVKKQMVKKQMVKRKMVKRKMVDVDRAGGVHGDGASEAVGNREATYRARKRRQTP